MCGWRDPPQMECGSRGSTMTLHSSPLVAGIALPPPRLASHLVPSSSSAVLRVHACLSHSVLAFRSVRAAAHPARERASFHTKTASGGLSSAGSTAQPTACCTVVYSALLHPSSSPTVRLLHRKLHGVATERNSLQPRSLGIRLPSVRIHGLVGVSCCECPAAACVVSNWTSIEESSNQMSS